MRRAVLATVVLVSFVGSAHADVLTFGFKATKSFSDGVAPSGTATGLVAPLTDITGTFSFDTTAATILSTFLQKVYATGEIVIDGLGPEGVIAADYTSIQTDVIRRFNMVDVRDLGPGRQELRGLLFDKFAGFPEEAVLPTEFPLSDWTLLRLVFQVIEGVGTSNPRPIATETFTLTEITKVADVPAPTALPLFSAGLAAVTAYRRNRQSKVSVWVRRAS